MFKSLIKNGRFSNDNGFILDFRHLLSSGYYFEFDQEKQIQVKKFLKDFEGDFVLEHWNKPEENCGLWDSKTNQYITPFLASIKQPFSAVISYRVQIDNHDIKPSYVIFYPNTVLVNHNGIYDIVIQG